MLDQLTGQLSEHVDYVFRSARGEGAWPAAARHYGVSSADVEGFAPVAEVRAVFDELVRRAGAHLEELVAKGQVEQGARVEGIRRRLSDLPARETQRYERARAEALEPKKPVVGVASIFANAAKTAANNPWASLTFDRQLTQHCATCGAPQRREREFQCEYCGGDVFRRGSDFE
jgi:hypothetical protein